MRSVALTAFLLVLLVSGCTVLVNNKLDERGDAGPSGNPDGSVDPDGSVTPDGGVQNCEGIADGTPCLVDVVDGFICLDDECGPSTCGDAFVDELEEEECDDGNEEPGDGCEPFTCLLTCIDDLDCDDGDPCTGDEFCDLDTNTCDSTPPEANTECQRENGEVGVCTMTGLCAAPGCGNSTPEGDEDCDDGNDDDEDGCKADCTFTCVTDEDCADGDACDAVEVCDTASNTCVDTVAPDCDDSEPCTEDSCDPSLGCENVFIDGDSDGYSPETCADTDLQGGDCDDDDVSAFPGAPEVCDGIDNDCNNLEDDNTVTVACGRDSDGDGFGSMRVTMSACECPDGFVGNTRDCNDDLSSVSPAQRSFQTRGYCPEGSRSCLRSDATLFDWNCDGDEQVQFRSTFRGCSGTSRLCTESGGWAGRSIPRCGQAADFQTCEDRLLLTCNEGEVVTRTQGCL